MTTMMMSSSTTPDTTTVMEGGGIGEVNRNTVSANGADNNSSNMNSTMVITSTTAPGMVFQNRNELAEHYKSDYHKYNLKRRENNLPMITKHDFSIRLQAAQAVLFQQQQHSTASSRDHIKNKNNTNKNKNKNAKKEWKQKNNKNGDCKTNNNIDTIELQNKEIENNDKNSSNFLAGESVKNNITPNDDTTNETTKKVTFHPNDDNDTKETNMLEDNNTTQNDPDDAMTTAENVKIMIDPCKSLFDSHVCRTVEENIQRMYTKYGFFLPDREYLIDSYNLIGYCHEKILIGNTCLYCQRIFKNNANGTNAAIQHMLDTNHTKLRYEDGIDLEEFEIFYDFTKANTEFLDRPTINTITTNTKTNNSKDGDDKVDNDDDDDDWEDDNDQNDRESGDDDDDDAMEDSDDDDDIMYDDYQDGIAKLGLDVTVLGELVFPDGRIIGHRSLRRYYKQKPRFTSDTNSVAVTAARMASRERLYRGQVYTLGDNSSDNDPGTSSIMALRSSSASAALSFQNAGIAPGTITGRVGKGILVPMKSTNGQIQSVSYSQLSIYRYRAAIKKQRKDTYQGQRLYNKQFLNMNHMDKKHNNIMNGVSVQHALR